MWFVIFVPMFGENLNQNAIVFYDQQFLFPEMQIHKHHD